MNILVLSISGCSSILGEPAWISVINQTDSQVDVTAISEYLDGDRRVEKTASLRSDDAGSAHTSFGKMFMNSGDYKVEIIANGESSRKVMEYQPGKSWRGVMGEITDSGIEIYPVYA